MTEAKGDDGTGVIPAEAADPAASRKEPRRSWPMAVINFWLDATLLLAVLVVVWVSVMLRIVFPPPTQADGWTVWGLDYDQWSLVQFVALCVAAGLAVEHLALHWNWVCSVLTTKILRRPKLPQSLQTVYGVATFVTALVLAQVLIVAALLSARSP